MSDEANSKLLLGVSGAEKINVKGRCYVKVNADLKECQSYYISDKQVKEIIKPYIKPKKENNSEQDKICEEKCKTAKNGTESLKKVNDNIVDLNWLDNL